MKDRIVIGTRGSKLALYQAELVKSKIELNFPLIPIEIKIIKTSGDMIRRGGKTPFETKRIFTREIEEALLHSDVDMAVHSAKDMSVLLPEGLAIGAVLKREDVRDCLISKDQQKLCELPLGARIGTSSLRRQKQLLRLNHELIVEDVHGNVDTRIKRVEDGNFDAIVLAYAGVKRLGLTQYVSEIFPADRFYPSPGQGAIVVQTRAGDGELGEVLCGLHHVETGMVLQAERAFLRRLEGGCQLPCGIWSRVEGDALKLAGGLFAVEDTTWAEAHVVGLSSDARELGVQLADAVLEAGGKEILEKMRGS